MRTGWVVLVAALAFLTLGRVAASGEVKSWEQFSILTATEQEKLAKKKVSKKGEYYFCKMGKYQVYSDKSPVAAFKWGLILNEFTDALLEEGVIPKKASRQGNPLVYVLKDREAYQKALGDYSKNMIDAGWSVGMFVPLTAKPALFAYDYSSELAGADTEPQEKENAKKDDTKKEDKPAEPEKGQAEVMSTILHECTHQMVYYHIGNNVMTWFNEGIATNMECYQFGMSCKANLYNAKYVNNRADGAAIISREDKLRKFSLLFDISGSQWLSASEDTARLNYSSTWAALNYMLTTKKGRDYFIKMEKAFKNGGEAAVRKMFSEKTTDMLDELIKTYVDTVLMPCCKYGRQARKALNEGDKELAGRILEKMKEEYPDNLELKFYESWLAILENQEPAKAVEQVKALLDDTDFFHPEVYYVLALGSKAAGNQSDFASYLKKAQDTYEAHPGTIELGKDGK